ncbi:MAG: hypothetical protein JW957_07770 [Candidatus Omnitrophica bacterium]|nr:hypothetical protein [Candidatus Omnitrophota bacterium]
MRLYVCGIDGSHTYTGLFFYLTFPAIKNILPSKDNEKILELADALRETAKYSAEQKQPFLFTIDMDAGTYTAELADYAYIDTQIEEGYEPPEPVRSSLQFVRARNSAKEASGGSISFLFMPDGTREFGTITSIDPDTEETYTVFLNPYLSEPEILVGDIDFNETYPF